MCYNLFMNIERERRPKIAVVAMQGDFQKHLDMLTRLGADAYPARSPADIAKADGIILPGGESTTIGKLLARYGVDKAIQQAAAAGQSPSMEPAPG